MTTPFQGAGLDVPSGVIVPWRGSGDTVPPGWAYCDGNNGTPDLRGRMPKCVPDSSTEPGATGGTNTKTLAVDELPSHNHSASTEPNGAHDHQAYNWEHNDGDIDGTSSRNYYVDIDSFWDSEAQTASAGAHSHNISISSTGGDGSFDNRPQYREMSFIQKL